MFGVVSVRSRCRAAVAERQTELASRSKTARNRRWRAVALAAARRESAKTAVVLTASALPSTTRPQCTRIAARSSAAIVAETTECLVTALKRGPRGAYPYRRSQASGLQTLAEPRGTQVSTRPAARVAVFRFAAVPRASSLLGGKKRKTGLVAEFSHDPQRSLQQMLSCSRGRAAPTGLNQ